MTEIKVKELKVVTSRLLEYLESENGDTLSLPEDYYWHIDADELHTVEEEPTDLSVGQLSEDWENLQRVASGESDPIRHSLVWLAAVLRAVGEA